LAPRREGLAHRSFWPTTRGSVFKDIANEARCLYHLIPGDAGARIEIPDDVFGPPTSREVEFQVWISTMPICASETTPSTLSATRYSPTFVFS
jgi:hypothetical protein